MFNLDPIQTTDHINSQGFHEDDIKNLDLKPEVQNRIVEGDGLKGHDENRLTFDLSWLYG